MEKNYFLLLSLCFHIIEKLSRYIYWCTEKIIVKEHADRSFYRNATYLSTLNFWMQKLIKKKKVCKMLITEYGLEKSSFRFLQKRFAHA